MKCNLRKMLLRWRVQSAAARDQAASDMTTPNAPAQTAGAVTPTTASKGSHSHVSNFLYVLNYWNIGITWGGVQEGANAPPIFFIPKISSFGTELRDKLKK